MFKVNQPMDLACILLSMCTQVSGTNNWEKSTDLCSGDCSQRPIEEIVMFCFTVAQSFWCRCIVSGTIGLYMFVYMDEYSRQIVPISHSINDVENSYFGSKGNFFSTLLMYYGHSRVDSFCDSILPLHLMFFSLL